jgi:hypothetical protein
MATSLESPHRLHRLCSRSPQLDQDLLIPGDMTGEGAEHQDRSWAGKIARRGRAAWMTVTVTATATANGYQQRPATAHNACTIRANLEYVRPEKQTVEDRSRSAMTAANTVAKRLDNACPVRTTLECRPSARTATDGPGRCAHSNGSEGWEFESLRARLSVSGEACSD